MKIQLHKTSASLKFWDGPFTRESWIVMDPHILAWKQLLVQDLYQAPASHANHHLASRKLNWGYQTEISVGKIPSSKQYHGNRLKEVGSPHRQTAGKDSKDSKDPHVTLASCEVHHDEAKVAFPKRLQFQHLETAQTPNPNVTWSPCVESFPNDSSGLAMSNHWSHPTLTVCKVCRLFCTSALPFIARGRQDLSKLCTNYISYADQISAKISKASDLANCSIPRWSWWGTQGMPMAKEDKGSNRVLNRTPSAAAFEFCQASET